MSEIEWLIDEIDAMRGDIPRSRFFEQLLKGVWDVSIWANRRIEEVKGYV